MSWGSKLTYTYKIETELSKADFIERFKNLNHRAIHNTGWQSISNYPDYSTMGFLEDGIVIKNFNSSESGKGTVYNVFIKLSEKRVSRTELNVSFKNIDGDIPPIYGSIMFESGAIIMALMLKFILKFSTVVTIIFYLYDSIFYYTLLGKLKK
ncbi:hypothetical protein IDJ77_23055 [Mucilaginibacter sp. ZT4R22]|uniref:Uncharacterized protein n=1 Tax=Mucilaginibacter pankratovii TaxID=2772110 RepID=A0ABR7WZ28_9SPHI|nr:hypothetical protein [Mucilaginibacter pankratovii]MBD1366709.1 hypothetical protein [Mucilaginibacter pankratovii]